jgi:hypothetical protein
MKNQKNKIKPRAKVVKELASQFEADFNKTLPINVRPDGSIVYKEFLILKTDSGNWGVYHLNNRSLIEEYYLKTCALMSAKAYARTDLNRFFEIKHLDNKYWASYCDHAVYAKNIKTAKDFSRYLILLNKLEHSRDLSEHFKEKISRMFKWSFV